MSPIKKPRSYSDFTLAHLREMFGLENQKRRLPMDKTLLDPSEWLKTSLERSKMAPLSTEKAKSEHLIVPVLLELKTAFPERFNYFSGYTFDIDAALSLKGRCDFLLTKQPTIDISVPVIAIFEAKDDNLDRWLGQCGAEMVAARLFNQRQEQPIEIIHGAVTNGYEWQFLRLEATMLWIDTERYSLENLPKLLGVLKQIIDFYHP